MNVPRQIDRFADTGNADVVIYNQNSKAMTETGIICSFATSWGEWVGQLFGKMLAAASGIEQFADADYLAKVGERIVNLERAFNTRDGFDRRHDTLPQRMFTEPLHTGGAPGEGQVIRELDRFLDDYYRLRGWTPNGIPTREKLAELGMGGLTRDLTG